MPQLTTVSYFELCPSVDMLVYVLVSVCVKGKLPGAGWRYTKLEALPLMPVAIVNLPSTVVAGDIVPFSTTE